MSDIPSPNPGDKFRAPKRRGLLSFIKTGQTEEGKVWWDFIDVETGKRYSYYPEDVKCADDVKRSTRKKNISREVCSDFQIEQERVPQSITIDGETINVL